MHDGGGNGTGRFVIEIWSDAAKLTDVKIAAMYFACLFINQYTHCVK